MQQTQTILLDQKQIEQKLNRIAYQIYEDNIDESEIILAGIITSGFILAKKIALILQSISPLNITFVEVHIDKHSHLQSEIRLSTPQSAFQGKTVILIDDVMNSGKTMMYSLKPFLQTDLKKLRTAVLVDRNHKTYPIAADFVGISLATTMHEHIAAILEGGNESVLLS